MHLNFAQICDDSNNDADKDTDGVDESDTAHPSPKESDGVYAAKQFRNSRQLKGGQQSFRCARIRCAERLEGNR